MNSNTAVPEAGAPFAEQLEHAAKQFVVRRDQGKTVIAGYPWFLDWGRDTFIAAAVCLPPAWLTK